MPYRYLDDIAIADAAFEAWGETREEMFRAAADALMNVMVEDLSTIESLEIIRIKLENWELDLLLFSFLNEFIFYKDASRLLLRVASISINEDNKDYSLQALLTGETINSSRHPLNVDVKAVTMHRLQVVEDNLGARATVVLDI